MTWIEAVSYKYVCKLRGDDPIFSLKAPKIRKLNNLGFSDNISPIAQFFLSKDVFGGLKTVSYIPVPNSKVCKKALQEIAVHYENVKMVEKGAEPNKLILQDVIKSSRTNMKKLLVNDKINPIVLDLFNSNQIVPKVNKTIYYKVKLNKIKFDTSFDPVWFFLNESFLFQSRSILITPNNWLLSEQIKDSLALKYFASKCDELILMVDSITNRVNGIEIFND